MAVLIAAACLFPGRRLVAASPAGSGLSTSCTNGGENSAGHFASRGCLLAASLSLSYYHSLFSRLFPPVCFRLFTSRV